MSIHQRFKEIRKILKLTQKKMASVLGKKDYSAIQKYENGRLNITDGVLLNLQEKFNVNIDWMRTGEGEMFIKKEENNIDYGKYQWLINTLDKLSDDDIKKVEQEAQKILEEQYNKEMNINPTKRIG